jgi:hypothetical protein
MLVLKFSLTKFSFSRGLLGSCFASTLRLNVMPMLMLINDFLYDCMLLIYRLCYHHHHVFNEGDRDHDPRSTFSHKTNILH